MTVIGIDPGVTGALAVIGEVGAKVYDLPNTKISSATAIDARGLTELLVEIGPVRAIFVEDVHANAISYKSNFSLGQAVGTILGVCAAIERPVRRIKAREWQQATGLTAISSKERKNAHRARAIEMWPSLSDDLRRVADHNRADALLIAEAGRRTL